MNFVSDYTWRKNMSQQIKELIQAGKTALGIEFGSTRIKGVLIDYDGNVLATGGYEWENRLENGVWTYHLEMQG